MKVSVFSLERIGKLFSLSEIESSNRLQIVFWSLWGLIIYDVTRISLSPQRGGEFVPCWEHIANCAVFKLDKIIFPHSYVYTLMMSILLSILFAGAYFAFTKKWFYALSFLGSVIVWRFVWNMVIFDYGTSNFDYFILIPGLIFIFSSYKLAKMRIVLSIFYLMSAAVKIDESWIAGTYFSSLKLGLPLFPSILIPWITNIVIILEMIFSIGLLSRNDRWSQFCLWSWTIFHLYSVSIVGFFYPVRCLVLLWCLFGFMKNDKADLTLCYQGKLRGFGLLIVFYFLSANFLPWLITPNSNETFEGKNYGFHMIDSNHQCFFRFKIFDKNNQFINQIETGSSNAMARCYPQYVLQKIKRLYCESNDQKSPKRVEWQFLHSRNGGPFYERINTQNACALEYRPFRHNLWIVSNQEGALVKGYPEKNSFYNDSFGPIPSIHLDPKIETTQFQNWLLKNMGVISFVYLAFWFFILFRLIRICL